jgi:hypothetical protein
MEVSLEGVDYRTGRLDVFDQFHIARRLAPLLATLGSKAKDLKEMAKPVTGEEPKSGENIEALDAVLEPLAKCIAEMSDEDLNYIIHTCLAVCTRKQPTGWAPVQSKGSRKLLFQDIGLPTLMGLTINTIQENMASFFPTEPRFFPAK